MTAPLVSIIVVNYNGGAHVERCLSDLQVQSFRDFEVIVIDNGSADGSFAAVRARIVAPQFRYVTLDYNAGFAAANNHGAGMAKGTWLALLNPDAFAAPDWLQSLIDATRRHPNVDLFGSTQISARDPARLDGAGDSYLAIGIPWRGGYGRPSAEMPTMEREVFSPCAAAALYRASVFRQLGGFDETFFGYCEDVDFGFRARLTGSICLQIPAAVVHHVGGGTMDQKSEFARYHGSRNMIWTFVKNMPGPLFWPLLPLHLAALAVLIVRAAFRREALAYLRALRDAAAALPAVWARRQSVQGTRTAGTMQIARILSWNPLRYFARRAV